MFIKIRDENYKVIVNTKSSINEVLSKVTERFRLKAIPHPHPFNVSYISSTALEVEQLCLVLVDFNLYKDKIWCDVVTLDVGQIILGRPWLFDKNVTIYSQSNMCQFSIKVRRFSYYP